MRSDNLNVLFTLLACLALAGCGGGDSSGGGSPTGGNDDGDGGGDPPAADTTPNAFEFPLIEDAALGEAYSSSITVTGIDALTPISVVGGQYAVNGDTFTTDNGKVKNEDVVTLRVFTATAYSSTSQAILTIGGVSASFTVSTPDDATAPENFGFLPVDSATPGSKHDADVKIVGVTRPAPVTVTNARYAIDGGAFTDAAGTVQDGQTITLRVVASESFETSVVGRLEVGGVGADLLVTTLPDPALPSLEVAFPPPVSMTDTDLPGHLVIRGTARDTDGAVTITLNGNVIAPPDAGGRWQAEYALVDGVQEIEIVAEDAFGNRRTRLLHLVRVATTGDTSVNLGDGVSFGNPAGIAFDPARSRIFYGDLDSVGALDLSTGTRSRLYASGMGQFNFVGGRIVRHPDGTLIAASRSGDIGIGRIDTVNRTGTAISVKGDGKGGDTDNEWNQIRALTLDVVGGVAYTIFSTAADGSNTLWRTSLADGSRSRVSADIYGSGNIGLAMDETSGKLVVANGCQLLHVDTNTGERTQLPISPGFCPRTVLGIEPGTVVAYLGDLGRIARIDLATPNVRNDVPGTGNADFGVFVNTGMGDASIDWHHRVAYVINDGGTEAGDRISAVDLETGFRVLVTLKH